MRPDDLSRAIPPHWHLYIAVENVDETSAKAATLGGKILESPFDVSSVGTISVIRDPTGTVFSIFRASGQTGWGIIGEPGSFCRADLITRDPERAERFYSDLLGWEIVGSRQDRSDYLQIHNRGRLIGGIPHPRHQGTNSPSHWLSYFCVSDVDEAAGKASSLGGKIWGVPMDVDDFGRMAIVADPQGAAFALFKSRSS